MEMSRLASALPATPSCSLHQPEQEVLGPDVVVVEHPRLFLGEDDGAAGSVREALEHLDLQDRPPHAAGRPKTVILLTLGEYRAWAGR